MPVSQQPSMGAVTFSVKAERGGQGSERPAQSSV